MVKLYATILLIIISNFINSQIHQIPDLDGKYQNNYIPNYSNNFNRAAFTQALNFPDSLSSFSYGLPKGITFLALILSICQKLISAKVNGW